MKITYTIDTENDDSWRTDKALIDQSMDMWLALDDIRNELRHITDMDHEGKTAAELAEQISKFFYETLDDRRVKLDI